MNVSVFLTAYYLLGDNEIIYSSLSYANMSHHIITVYEINASHKTYRIHDLVNRHSSTRELETVEFFFFLFREHNFNDVEIEKKNRKMLQFKSYEWCDIFEKVNIQLDLKACYKWIIYINVIPFDEIKNGFSG